MAHTCWNCFQEKPNSGACPFCGYVSENEEEKYPNALHPGSILNGRYIIGRVIGQGGFGITYIAKDYKTGERVAIKEYLPSEFAGRNGNSVQAFSKDQKENFEYGKEQFLAEAKTLAAFIGDEHIVRIYSFFEENNTAYFAMEYVDGLALDKYMAQQGGRLSVAEANRLLLPLMESLNKVHAKGIVHRDISPDNIIVTKDGSVKLIDFGAARYSTGEKSRSLDVILKHGFAPPEQYMRRGRQGPFTDVYALAATYYYAITGKLVPDAVERMQEDTIMLPRTLGIKISRRQEDALLKALEVNAADRYQNMGEFYREMTQAAGIKAGVTAQKKQTGSEPESLSQTEREALEEAKRLERQAQEARDKAKRLEKERQERERREKEAGKQAEKQEQERKAREETERRKQEKQRQKQKVRAEKERKRAEKQDKPKKKGPIAAVAALGLALVLLAVIFGVKGGFRTSPNATEAAVETENPPKKAEEPGQETKKPAQQEEWQESEVPEEEESISNEPVALISAEGLSAVQTVGSIVTFGAYEQDNDSKNGEEPIEWIVLDVQDEKSLLVSRYGLECRGYSKSKDTSYWEICSFRTWLNDTFLKAAFTASDRLLIAETELDNQDPKGGNDSKYSGTTTDRLFPLSYYEVIRYFNNSVPACEPTPYVLAKGAYVNSDGSCWWWMRYLSDNTPNTGGTPKNADADEWDFSKFTAQPALRIDTGKLRYMIPGNVVTFGSYEQDNDLTNGKEPIEWLVLDVQDNKALMISRYALDCQQYNTEYKGITWEKCTLRTWLNGTFLKAAFSSDEQARIPTVTVSADKNPSYRTSPGNSTKDQVFLLSITEANDYFGSDDAGKCVPTDYAIAQGAYRNNNYQVDGKATCWWWLRSPGLLSSFAANVSSVGSVNSYGNSVDFVNRAVRPALRIDLGS